MYSITDTQRPAASYDFAIDEALLASAASRTLYDAFGLSRIVSFLYCSLLFAEAVLEQRFHGRRRPFARVFVAGPSSAAGFAVLLRHVGPEQESCDFEFRDPVFDPHADLRLVNRAVANRNAGIAARAGAAHAQGVLAIAEDAAFDHGFDVLLDIERGDVVDLRRLVPAVEVAVADDESAAFAVGHRLGVDGILARPFSFVKPAGIGLERRGPERATLDRHRAARAAVGIELHGVAGGVTDVAIANRDVAPTAGDAVRIFLICERAGQHVMDAAVLDEHARAEHADGVERAAEDFAVAERDVVGRDFHKVAAAPAAVEPVVFIDARRGDFKPLDVARIRETPDLPRRADRRRLRGRREEGTHKRRENSERYEMIHGAKDSRRDGNGRALSASRRRASATARQED